MQLFTDRDQLPWLRHQAQGRRPDPDKIKAIRKMSAPKDVSQLRAFSLDLLLTHFDPNLPITVATDASNYRIVATLSQRFPDGSEKVVYHASRCLTTAQKNCSQIEKEALALIFAVQNFHRFVHGRQFTLKTDQKPLVAIFGSKKGIPVYSAHRLQRRAAMLLNYNFAIEYVNTRDFGQVDALSHLIASQSSTPEDYVVANVDVDVPQNLSRTAVIFGLCRNNPDCYKS
ncbi:hypothetical protein V3C99_007638 [Haemonchus contortus]